MASDRGRFENGIAVAELVVIVVIIVILSSVAVPYMRGRTDDANKWSEGKAIAVSICTAADNYIREKSKGYDFSGVKLGDLGFKVNPGEGGGDLDSRYFTDDCFEIKFSKNGDYLITIDAVKSTSGTPPYSPQKMTLDNSGKFTEIP